MKRKSSEQISSYYEDSIDLGDSYKDQKQLIKNICQYHQKELKYLNYSQEQGPIFVCKKCITMMNLTEAYSINSIGDEQNSKFIEKQRDNYHFISDEFVLLQTKFDKTIKSLYKFVDDLKEKVESILQTQLLKELEKDQKNVLYDITSSIRSLLSNKLTQQEFEMEISEYFKKEKSIANPKDKRYNDINKFFTKITQNFSKFKKEILLTFSESLDKQENEDQEIQINAQKEITIQEHLNLYRKSSMYVNELQSSNLRYFKQIPQSEMELKQTKPINLFSLQSSNDIRMITSKNGYGDIFQITQALNKVFPYAQKLKVLQIKNFQHLKQDDSKEFVSLLEKKPFLRLIRLELDIKNAHFKQNLCKYLSQFSYLYPKLKHFKLSLGQNSIEELSKNISDGLSPIKQQLISFQLNITFMKPENIQQIQNFLLAIIEGAKKLKVLQLKFSSLIIGEEERYKSFKNIFDYIVQALSDHINIEILEISIPFIKDGLSDFQLTSFTNIIKQQTQLKALKLKFNYFSNIKPKQFHQILNTLDQNQNLQCLGLAFPKSSLINNQSVLLISNILNNNHQTQEIKLDFSFTHTISEESLFPLCKSFASLVNITKLKLRFNISQEISDLSINGLSESLSNIYKQTNELKIEQFELNLKCSKAITESSVINLIKALEYSKNLKKLKLSFKKNKFIGNKCLKYITDILQKGAFKKLHSIMLEFGSDKFENQIIQQYLNELVNYEQLTEIGMFFGPSLFNDDVVQGLIQLVTQCLYLKTINFNFYQSNAFSNKLIKQLIKKISQLNFTQNVTLDFYNTKYANLIDIVKFLTKVEQNCFGKLKVCLSQQQFHSFKSILQYLDQKQKDNINKQIINPIV